MRRLLAAVAALPLALTFSPPAVAQSGLLLGVESGVASGGGSIAVVGAGTFGSGTQTSLGSSLVPNDILLVEGVSGNPSDAVTLPTGAATLTSNFNTTRSLYDQLYIKTLASGDLTSGSISSATIGNGLFQYIIVRGATTATVMGFQQPSSGVSLAFSPYSPVTDAARGALMLSVQLQSSPGIVGSPGTWTAANSNASPDASWFFWGLSIPAYAVSTTYTFSPYVNLGQPPSGYLVGLK